MDLEADLGIDTVKQAEVIAAIREAYGIERDDGLKLRDYPTLKSVVGFVIERAPQALEEAAAAVAVHPSPRRSPPPSRAAPAPPPPAAAANAAEDAITQRVMELVAEQTGYPTDLLDPELDLEADLGIDTVKQAEVFAAIREAYSIERDDSMKLRDYPTLKSVVGFVRDRAPRRSRLRLSRLLRWRCRPLRRRSPRPSCCRARLPRRRPRPLPRR